MSTADAGANIPMSGDQTGSHFNSLPKTTMGWVAIAVAIAYSVLAAIMANTVLGLPTWLDFALGLVPGAVAAVLVGIAIIRQREHSWLIWVALVGVVYFFGGWLVFAALASL